MQVKTVTGFLAETNGVINVPGSSQFVQGLNGKLTGKDKSKVVKFPWTDQLKEHDWL